MSDDCHTVVSADPLAVRVTIEEMDATLSTVIEDDLSVETVREVREC